MDKYVQYILGPTRARTELLRYYAPSRIIHPQATATAAQAIENTVRVILHSAHNEPTLAGNADQALARVMAQSDAIDTEAVEEQVRDLEARLQDTSPNNRQITINTTNIDIDGDITMELAAATPTDHHSTRDTSPAAADNTQPSRAATHDSDYSDDEYEQKYCEYASRERADEDLDETLSTTSRLPGMTDRPHCGICWTSARRGIQLVLLVLRQLIDQPHLYRNSYCILCIRKSFARQADMWHEESEGVNRGPYDFHCKVPIHWPI